MEQVGFIGTHECSPVTGQTCVTGTGGKDAKVNYLTTEYYCEAVIGANALALRFIYGNKENIAKVLYAAGETINKSEVSDYLNV